MKSMKYILIFLAVVLLSGCGKQQVLLHSYTPPRDIQIVKGMISKNPKLGQYLVIAINPDVVVSADKKSKKIISKYLVSSLESMLTQTNFVTINPVYDDANVTVDMEVLEHNISDSGSKISGSMKVKFTITNGAISNYSVIYDDSQLFQTSKGARLPSASDILSKMSNNICEKFADDITPLKTRKLVELKALPSALAYTITYAVAGNYSRAIDAMEKYQGTKDMEYFFDLGIYYEGLASQVGDFSLLEKANENYEQAMAMGGTSDDLVIKEKTKFDKFYDLIKLINQQRENNKNKIKDLNFKNNLKETYE